MDRYWSRASPSRYVWTCWFPPYWRSKNFFKFHINHLLFSSFAGHVAIKKENILILNQINNNGLHQHPNWCWTLSYVCGDWWGDVTNWATNGLSNRKNLTQAQAVSQILFQRGCSQAAPLRTFHQKGEMSPLWQSHQLR